MAPATEIPSATASFPPPAIDRACDPDLTAPSSPSAISIREPEPNSQLELTMAVTDEPIGQLSRSDWQQASSIATPIRPGSNRTTSTSKIRHLNNIGKQHAARDFNISLIKEGIGEQKKGGATMGSSRTSVAEGGRESKNGNKKRGVIEAV
ncbi:hypothetical protein ACLOJK_010713 [Asimina triloba]